jgi:TRAP-type C4-dicarboxylate transport system substrate-binding protein
MLKFTRNLTIAAAAAATIGLAAQAPAFADEMVDGPEVHWVHSVWGSKRAFTAGTDKMAELLAKRTGGKFTMETNYGGLAKSKEELDGIQLGAYQVAHFCNFYHPDKNPAFMVFTMPFLPIGDWDVRVAVTDAFMSHPAAIADMERWNAIPYVSSVLPQYEFLGRGKPPRTLADWKGMRVRAGGGVGKAMEVLGATLETVPATEVYTLIEQGTVDAVSFPYTYAHAAYKVNEVADWYTSNMNPGTSECPVVINKDAYEALPQQYKDLLEDIKPAIYEAQVAAYKEADEKNLPMFEKEMTKIVYDDETLAKFQEEAGQPVWDEWVADNPDIPAQEILDFILEEAKKAKMN